MQICGSNKSVIISEKDRYGFNHIVNLCLQRSLIYGSPRYDNKTLIYFYENLYGDEKPKKLFAYQIRKGDRIFKFINITNLDNLLEIGCGAGGILYPFMKKGHSVVGSDF